MKCNCAATRTIAPLLTTSFDSYYYTHDYWKGHNAALKEVVGFYKKELEKEKECPPVEKKYETTFNWKPYVGTPPITMPGGVVHGKSTLSILERDDKLFHAACAAMQSLAPNFHKFELVHSNEENCAKAAVRYARALLKELENQNDL